MSAAPLLPVEDSLSALNLPPASLVSTDPSPPSLVSVSPPPMAEPPSIPAHALPYKTLEIPAFVPLTAQDPPALPNDKLAPTERSSPVPYSTRQVADMAIAIVKTYLFFQGHIPYPWDQLVQRRQTVKNEGQAQPKQTAASIVEARQLDKLILDADTLFAMVQQSFLSWSTTDIPSTALLGPIHLLIQSGSSPPLTQHSLLVKFHPVSFVPCPALEMTSGLPERTLKTLIRRIMPNVPWSPLTSTAAASLPIRLLVWTPRLSRLPPHLKPLPHFRLDQLRAHVPIPRLWITDQAVEGSSAPPGDTMATALVPPGTSPPSKSPKPFKIFCENAGTDPLVFPVSPLSQTQPPTPTSPFIVEKVAMKPHNVAWHWSVFPKELVGVKPLGIL
ncbi:hypothetical protein BJ085DRAFT_33221 [Dimargaris cristalligena]|uniref:Uncharacterized protein n=1 Tax=Dimargaris cristalligena TaxID=215637 RepID=A0A4P9ZZ60_9FUNG|nr:hypothetical protein BJ085DRAFT_33221 [Dimargaris cristalligena]|eukprot:RKP38262.1 hypothetical protein BJ085DRAFT_33221 [Dimargaris cristalligena]